MNEKELFRTFTEQLGEWSRTGKEPELGDWRNETYVCPNCGNITKIAALEDEGCAYCGTHFLMAQLYPKVTNFYILDNLSVKKFGLRKLLYVF